MEGEQSMTNRELAIVGYMLSVLSKNGLHEEVQRVADMMQGLDKPDKDNDKE